MKFRKKPVVIEAMLFKTNSDADNKNMNDLVLWMNQGQGNGVGSHGGNWHNGTSIFIKTDEGLMEASCGDWIIKGVKGEFYPCKPDVFAMTHEPVEAHP